MAAIKGKVDENHDEEVERENTLPSLRNLYPSINARVGFSKMVGKAKMKF